MKSAIWIIAVIAVFSLIFASIDTSPAASQARDQQSRERETIRQCRKAQNDELSELATRRMMRQACDKLQADFDRKWRNR